MLTLQCLAQRVLQALQGLQEPLERLVLQVTQGQLVHKVYRALQGLQVRLEQREQLVLLDQQELMLRRFQIY